MGNFEVFLINHTACIVSFLPLQSCDRRSLSPPLGSQLGQGIQSIVIVSHIFLLLACPPSETRVKVLRFEIGAIHAQIITKPVASSSALTYETVIELASVAVRHVRVRLNLGSVV